MKTPLMGNEKCSACGIKDRGRVKYDRRSYIYFLCAHCGVRTYYTDDGKKYGEKGEKNGKKEEVR